MTISATAATGDQVTDVANMTQVEQLLDFYAFLIQANGLVARADDTAKLYDDICRLGIQLDRRLVLAWVGVLDEGTQEVHAVAHAGSATGYLADLRIMADPAVPEGRGPAGRALREGHCIVINRFLEDATTAPWHAKAREFGIAACAAVPLRRGGTVCGALFLYANAVDVFEESLTDELEVLSQTLSYAIDTARQRERERRQTERWLTLLRLAQAGEYAGAQGEHEFLRRALDEARRLTGSSVGFIHLVSANQLDSDLVAWGGSPAENDNLLHDRCYPIGKDAIWVHSFHERHGLIFNDFKCGAEPAAVRQVLTRLIIVPVIDNDKVLAIAWIGGKEDAYDQDDLEFLQILASDAWRIVRRHRAEDDLREAQNQLLQSEKMASIGQLAAGVAHEINNPIGFVNSNLGTLGNYVQDLLHLAEAGAASPAGKALAETIDLDFLRSDIPALLNESKDGLNRVRKIVQDLKDFSRVGEVHWQLADIHQGLDSTLNIVANEIKYKCTVSKEYGKLPPIFCLPSQLNQVFMNLLVNAAQAIETRGEIIIRTELAGNDAVRIKISDTGRGIAPEHLNRLFDPFFTTKPVGKGTGLGLSLAWSIIARHHGQIEVTSTVGQGSTFTITLPIKPPAESADEASTNAVPPAPTF
jgi:signal transduction histidine kinase